MPSLEFREEDRGIPLGIRCIWIRILAVERWFGASPTEHFPHWSTVEDLTNSVRKFDARMLDFSTSCCLIPPMHPTQPSTQAISLKLSRSTVEGSPYWRFKVLYA